MKTPTKITPAQRRAAIIVGAITAGTIPVLFIALAMVQTTIFSSTDMASNIARLVENETLFRVSLFVEVLMYLSVAVLGWGFYVILKPISKVYALLGLLLRSLEAMFGFLGVMAGIAILLVVGNTSVPLGFSTEQIAATVSVLRDFQSTVNLMIPFFLTPASLIFYWLFIRSRYIPKWLAIAGLFAYSVVLVNAVMSLLTPSVVQPFSVFLVLPVVAFEFTIGLWLIRGKLRSSES